MAHASTTRLAHLNCPDSDSLPDQPARGANEKARVAVAALEAVGTGNQTDARGIVVRI
jgi:hypothetical protein